MTESGFPRVGWNRPGGPFGPPSNADRFANFGNRVFLLPNKSTATARFLFLSLSYFFSPAAFFCPARPRRGEPGIRPCGDQVTLKLRERLRQSETLACYARRGGVDSLCHDLETNSLPLPVLPISSISCLSDRPSRSRRPTHPDVTFAELITHC